MTLRILPGLAALATLTLFSCYPMPENQHARQGPSSHQTISSPEQQKMELQRERLKKQAELERQSTPEAGGPVTDPGATTAPKPPTETKRDYPFANPVPGKEGFVFSPYNSKVIDVRDMPTGTLVQDPTYPAAEKKFFRVP